MKDYEEAKKCFLQAIELDKKQAISYAWLADSEKELGNWEKAKQAYERAYELTSNPQYQKEKKAMEEKIKPEKKGFFSKIFG
jgi:tetratricopeptide (TPR) repeat protein